MSIKPTGVIDYGQYDADQGAITTERRIPAGGFVNGGYFNGISAAKPTESISISLEFLRGAEAAAQWAHDNYGDTESGDIYGAVAAGEVDRLREEAKK